MSHPKHLTLIVATTTKLGIGRNGSLPWPMLKGEMGYFSRVTKRVPAVTKPKDADTSGKHNAVIMGRKTWESIPPKFRPLKGRTNVVISRSLRLEGRGEGSGESGETAVHVVESLGDAVDLLQKQEMVQRVFVIGGSSVYEAALKHPATERVLLTMVTKPEFECDTFFPVDLGSGGGWKRGTREDLEQWTGEDFGEEGTKREEKEVEYEFCLFEEVNN